MSVKLSLAKKDSVRTEGSVNLNPTSLLATAQLVSLDSFARLTSMTAPLVLVTTEEPVRIKSKATLVLARQAIPVSNVKKKSPAVPQHPATADPCARTNHPLAISPASAVLDTPDLIVAIRSILALPTHALIQLSAYH